MITERRTSDPRGDATRQRILDAAIAMFARAGFDGASTRHLAAEAGVNQPAIQYHFASKEGLYRAAVDLIADDLRGRMHPYATEANELLRANAPEAELEAMLLRILDAFAGTVLNREHHESWGYFIARTEIESIEMLGVLSDVITTEIVKPCAALIGRLLGTPDEKSAFLRALALLGMVTAFKNRCLSGAIRRALGWGEFGEGELDAIKAIVREQAKAMLATAKEAGS